MALVSSCALWGGSGGNTGARRGGGGLVGRVEASRAACSHRPGDYVLLSLNRPRCCLTAIASGHPAAAHALVPARRRRGARSERGDCEGARGHSRRYLALSHPATHRADRQPIKGHPRCGMRPAHSPRQRSPSGPVLPSNRRLTLTRRRDASPRCDAPPI